jgi:hypothetical protein
MFEEGQIADGPNGPLVYRGGRWYPLQQTQQPPADPTFPYKGPQAEADARKSRAEADLIAAQAPYADVIARAQVERDLAAAEKARAEAGGGAKTQAQQGEERDRVSRLNQLAQQINRVEDLYRAGPGMTAGVGALADFNPFLEANAKLDVAGAQLAQQGLAAFRVPGTGTVSDRDAVMFDRGNLPTAATMDAKNEEILRGLKSRVEEELKALGQPAPQWGKAFAAEGQNNTNALGQIRTNEGNFSGQLQAAPLADASGRNYREVYNPAFSRAHDELVRSLVSQGGGRLDPDEYAAAFARLTSDFGYNDPAGPAGRKEWANAVNASLDGGARTIPTDVTARELMTMRETAANNLINNPFTGAVAGVANGVGAGIPEMLAPAEFAALRDSQGWPMIVGEVGGAVGGVSALGKLGRVAASRAAPGLLGGGATGQALRNVAVDTAYGAAYGQNTRGDPLTGAAFGAGGSVLGQGVAKGIGAAVGGMQRTAAAQALRDRGVPISVARQLGLGRAEDVIGSLPIAGDVARARQADSFVGFNQAAFQEGARPIGATIPSIAGRDGVTALDNAVGTAYDDATRGVTVSIDPQFTTDFAALARQVAGLPGDYQSAARQVIQNRVAPAVSGGRMTGEQYQQAIRGIRAARSNADNVGNTGFEQDYRNVLGSAEDALTGAMGRGGGQQTVEGLGRANQAFGNLKILEDAALNRARVGTRSGEVNVFTPSQLLDSASKAESTFGNGAALRELGEQGQKVLPSTLPNSGTADRLIALGLIGSAGSVGAGGGFLGAEQDQGLQGAASGAGTGLGGLAGISAALAALGTRRGQQALEQILISRPQVAQAVGQGFRRRGGLFGSAGAVAVQPDPDAIRLPRASY